MKKKRENGQGLVEYAILLALVAGVIAIFIISNQQQRSINDPWAQQQGEKAINAVESLDNVAVLKYPPNPKLTNDQNKLAGVLASEAASLIKGYPDPCRKDPFFKEWIGNAFLENFTRVRPVTPDVFEKTKRLNENCGGNLFSWTDEVIKIFEPLRETFSQIHPDVVRWAAEYVFWLLKTMGG